MLTLDAAAVHATLDYPGLIDRLRQAFRGGATAPMRYHHAVPVPGGAAAALLLMPAWAEGRHIGVKIVTVFPDNGRCGLPSVMGQYLLLDGATGAPLATIDGPALTARRTAAASALAAAELARPDAARLLMIGTGALARQLIPAHAAIRELREIAVWGRTPDHARRLAAELGASGFAVEVADDLEAAVRHADIISCATLASAPLVQGRWLSPGSHLDLVGGFTPTMREADDEAIARATVYVDTRDGALAEAGDIVQPVRTGILDPAAIAGDLFQLACGACPGRRSAEQITLFKSVGTALEDLAAAQLLVERAGR